MIFLPRSFNELDWRPPVEAFGHLESGEGPAEAALRKGAAGLTRWPKEALPGQMVIL